MITNSPYVPTQTGEDGWCVRDAFCAPFEWAPGSDEWQRFREGPAGRDVARLDEHLSLTCFGRPEDWDELFRRSAHPGIAWFIFPSYHKAHTVYVPDVRLLVYHFTGSPLTDGPAERPRSTGRSATAGPLGSQHVLRGPELDAVIVDERQAPHIT